MGTDHGRERSPHPLVSLLLAEQTHSTTSATTLACSRRSWSAAALCTIRTSANTLIGPACSGAPRCRALRPAAGSRPHECPPSGRSSASGAPASIRDMSREGRRSGAAGQAGFRTHMASRKTPATTCPMSCWGWLSPATGSAVWVWCWPGRRPSQWPAKAATSRSRTTCESRKSRSPTPNGSWSATTPTPPRRRHPRPARRPPGSDDRRLGPSARPRSGASCAG